MKVSKRNRNKHIAWTLAKYADSVREIKAQIVSLYTRTAERIADDENLCTSPGCTPDQWVKLVPGMNHREEQCEVEVRRLTDSQSLIGGLDALKAYLPA